MIYNSSYKYCPAERGLGPVCIFFTVVQQALCGNRLHNELLKNWPVLNISIIEKAAEIFNFCLVGNICHNNLVIGPQDFHAYSDTISTQSVKLNVMAMQYMIGPGREKMSALGVLGF